MIDDWHKHIEAAKEICAVFLDLQKASDSVPHRNLLLVLKQMGLHPTLLKWLCSYLTSWVQRVVVNGETSSEVHAISGVPQGSVLGPLLFVIYINNVTSLSFSPGTQITLYADDILLYKLIGNFDDYHFIQIDLHALSQWSDDTYLTFNPKRVNSC